MNHSQQSALTQYIQSIQDPEIVKIVGQQLLKEGVIQLDATFGRDKPTSKNISDLINKAPVGKESEVKVENAFIGIGKQLLADKTKREQVLKKNFNQLLASLLLGLLLLQVSYMFEFKPFLIIGVSGVLFLLGIFLYIQYNNAFKRLTSVDRELNRLNFISAKFELVACIQNSELKKEASKYLLQELTSPGIMVNNRIENMIYGSSITAGGNVRVGNIVKD